MSMTPSDWIALAGLLLSALGSAAAVWWTLSRKISGVASALHARVDKIKDDYVRRDDMQRIERGQENLAAKVDQLSSQLMPTLADLARAMLLRHRE